MTSRQTRDDARPETAATGASRRTDTPISRPADPAPITPARSAEEAEARYVAARDGWTAAMRVAATGRAADLASLAIAQEAYESASRERDEWSSGIRAAATVKPEPTRSAIDVIVGQQLAWRRVHHEDEEPPKRGILGRIGRKLRGR